MSGTADTTLAALAALAAACSFGVGVVLQHRQAQLAPTGGRAPFRLLAHLARQRLWLAGIALNAAAYGLQALALAFGPLSLVAPIAATDLLFALPLAARWSRRPMRTADWAGCLLTGGGVALFLITSPPSAGRSDAPTQDWVLAFAAIALVAGAAVTAARLTRGPARASFLALTGGAVFGLTSALTLSVTRLLSSQNLGQLVGNWQPWALAVLGAVGLLLSASTFRAGALSASLPVIDSAEPICAVLIGTVVFGERLAASPADLALQLAGAVAAVSGIILLGRSPLTARAYSHAVPDRWSSSRGDSRPRHDRASCRSPRPPYRSTQGKDASRHERIDLAPHVMPIVMTVVLAVWLAMVIYTDAYPPTCEQDTAKPGDDPGETTEPGRRVPPPPARAITGRGMR